MTTPAPKTQPKLSANSQLGWRFLMRLGCMGWLIAERWYGNDIQVIMLMLIFIFIELTRIADFRLQEIACEEEAEEKRRATDPAAVHRYWQDIEQSNQG